MPKTRHGTAHGRTAHGTGKPYTARANTMHGEPKKIGLLGERFWFLLGANLTLFFFTKYTLTVAPKTTLKNGLKAR